jgi:CRP-like cAMP-binding protein
MAGKVIQTLRLSPLATNLTEAELRLLANSGRIVKYGYGETILLEESGLDERMFLLRDGRVSLHMVVWTESSQCGGEATIVLTSPGEPFGWSAWIRQDFLTTSAIAVEPVSMAAFDLQRLGDTQTFMKVSQRMLQILYGSLQEYGLCPPNIKAWMKMKSLLLAGEGL